MTNLSWLLAGQKVFSYGSSIGWERWICTVFLTHWNYSMDVFDLKAVEMDKVLVKDVMSPSALTASKGETVAEVISKMRKAKVREVPILEGDKPIGLVSYASFVSRRNVPLTAKAEHIMIPCPKLEEDMKVIRAAEEMMVAGVRGAPVVRNQKMIGFLSRTDIMKMLPKVDELKDRPVGSFMSGSPQTVTQRDTVRKAQILMKGLNARTLPVTDEANRLVGAVGMTEVMNVIWSSAGPKPPNEIMGGREPLDPEVGGVMSRNPVSIAPTDTVSKAVSIMLEKGLSTLFVTDSGKLVGVLSQADLMEQIIGLKPREGLYVQMTGLDFHDPEVYDALYEQIGKAMKRIDKIESLRVFTIHTTVYHSEGMKSKYSMGARLTTEKQMYYAKSVDWDVYRAMNNVLEMIEKSVKKEHGKSIDLKKHTQ